MSLYGRSVFVLSLACAVVLAVVSFSSAGRYNSVLDVGDDAPEWQQLEGTDGNKHSLTDYKDAKAIVLVFTCNQCPVAAGYEARIKELQKQYKDQGVQVIAVSVSQYEEDSLPKMKERATAHEFNFPYLWDGTQEIGRNYGARVTPQAFVLDADRKIIYMGKIDDSPLDPSAVKQYFIRDAVEAALKGSKPKVSENRAQGCGIMYQ